MALIINKIHALIFLVFFLALFALVFVIYSNTENTNSNISTTPKQNTPQNPLASSFTIQAWVYPGNPACEAKREYEDGRIIDVLKPEYFSLDSSGNVKLLTEGEAECNAYSQENFNSIKANSKMQFITISSDHVAMRQLFKDPQKINSSIETLTNFIVENNATGLEIDFEDFSAWTRSDYTNFLEYLTAIKSKLNSKGKILMVDGPAIISETQNNFLFHYEDLANLGIEYLVVMAYDYQYDFGVGSPVAPNRWIVGVVEYTAQKIANKSKLIVGISSYGYMGEVGSYKATPLTKDQAVLVSGFETAKRNPDSFEHYWTYNGKYYSYIDSNGLAERLALIKNLGVNGVSVWHLGGNDWFSSSK